MHLELSLHLSRKIKAYAEIWLLQAPIQDTLNQPFNSGCFFPWVWLDIFPPEFYA